MEHHGSFPWTLLINLALLVVGVVLWKGRELAAIFQGRHDEVKRKIDEANQYHREASDLLHSCEAQMKDLDHQIADMMRTAQEAAEHERRLILERAEQAAQKIVSDAQTLAAQHMERVRKQIQSEVSAQAIELVRQQLLNSPSEKQHHMFLESFLTSGSSHASIR